MKEKLMNETIDNELRDSHAKQINFISKLSNVPLGADEPDLISKFIEITERRNCHIHCNGKVSEQYIQVCNEYKYKFEKEPKIGEALNVSGKYLKQSLRILSEMAFKISQTVVRKNFPDQIDDAERHANTIGLSLLSEHRWEDALMIFDYAASLRDGWAGDDGDYKNNIINKAQALIGLGRKDEAIKVIEREDWSASHPRYLMAIHILKEEYEKAAKLLAIADITEEDYREWPIFEKYRQSEQFKAAFLAHFAHDYDVSTIEAASKAIAEIESRDDIAMPQDDFQNKPLENNVDTNISLQSQ